MNNDKCYRGYDILVAVEYWFKKLKFERLCISLRISAHAPCLFLSTTYSRYYIRLLNKYYLFVLLTIIPANNTAPPETPSIKIVGLIKLPNIPCVNSGSFIWSQKLLFKIW